MRGSFQIAKFFGIPVFIHWSFALIFAWVFYLGVKENWNWTSISVSIVFVIGLFICVVMHEFGHALTARRYGVQTRDIILSPIGGVARLDRLPDKPMQEFYVAIAGPLVNIGIMVILAPYFFFVSADTLEEFRSILRGYFGIHDNVFIRSMTPVDFLLFGLLMLNGTLAIFNLLPAFPMDGGRVLRALLSLRLGRAKATRIAAYIGQFLAVLLVVYGIWHDFNWVTIFIGIFVFTTAAQENRMVHVESQLEQHTVGEIVRPNFTKFHLADAVEVAAEELKRGLEKDFLVFDEAEQLRGVLLEDTILKAIREQHLQVPIEQFFAPHFKILQPHDTLQEAFTYVHWHGHNICPVYTTDNQLIGVIDHAMLQNFIKLQQRIKL